MNGRVAPRPLLTGADAATWTCAPPPPEAAALHRGIPGYAPTPLRDVPGLAAEWGVRRVVVKDESARFGLVEAVVGLSPGAGGTQRMAERAGPARAREFVISQGIYEAATLERWNVVNRVLPDDELIEKGMRFAHRLASGPTKAHAVTKRVVRAYLEGGVEQADDEVPGLVGSLFETDDLKGAVKSFLSEGPGKATFEGR